MSGRLAGKVVVVTGAAQGIGFGCARKGCRGRRSRGAGRYSEGTRGRGGGEDSRGRLAAIFQFADVTDETQCAALVAQQ